MSNDPHSFRRDQRARSFRVTDFTLRDFPLLILSFALLTVFSMVVAWLLGFLPAAGHWVILGLSVGFYLGLVFARRFRRPVVPAADPAPTPAADH